MPSIMPKGGWDDPAKQPPQRVSQQPQPRHVYAQEVYAQPSYLTCKVCDRGLLVSKSKFRMSAPVVVIGFILLIPSVLGIIFSVIAFFASATHSSSSLAQSNASNIAQMRRAGVPRRIINALVAENKTDIDEWLNSDYGGSGPPPQIQQDAVKAAQENMTAGTVGSGLSFLVGGGFSIIFGVAALVGGLLGWLLVMKKRVLQCSTCGAVINAS